MMKNKLICNRVHPHFLENNHYIFTIFQNLKNMNFVDCRPPEGDITTHVALNRVQV